MAKVLLHLVLRKMDTVHIRWLNRCEIGNALST